MCFLFSVCRLFLLRRELGCNAAELLEALALGGRKRCAFAHHGLNDAAAGFVTASSGVGAGTDIWLGNAYMARGSKAVVGIGIKIRKSKVVGIGIGLGLGNARATSGCALRLAGSRWEFDNGAAAIVV